MGRPKKRFARNMPLLIAMGLFSHALAAHSQPLEAAVKATYLYKIVPFVKWPQTDQSGPFNLCIVGNDPFGDVLDRAIAGQVYNNRPFQVTRLSVASAASPCDLAYLGGSAQQSVGSALQTLKGQPVLTVTDEGSAAGIVDFTTAGGRVRFRIDEDGARRNGLSISSKLLGLALSVNKSREGQGQP